MYGNRMKSTINQGAVNIVQEQPVPMPFLLDFGDVVFCVHLVIYQQQHSSWDCHKLAAEQPLVSANGTVRHGRRYGPPTIVKIIAP
jgi:hypothetical protein